MSFINLLANDIWSDADITNKTEAIIHSKFSVLEENILNRKVTGVLIGSYVMSPEEELQLQRYKEFSERAKQEGIDARNDMALLLRVFELEKAYSRLNLPVVEPEYDEDGNILNQEQLDIDLEERSVAQEVVDSATEEEQELYLLRNPFVEEVVPDEEIIQSTGEDL